MILQPVVILGIGIATVLVLILVLRLNAFLALISAAMLVSVLSPGEPSQKITRVAEAFGTTAGKIGVVIAMAAIIGRCLIDSGAADRIVRTLVGCVGQRRGPVALMASGFVLSIPVFFDTVFYLLLPIARSMHRRTGTSYLLLILTMGAGASITHSLVPPTPGPLITAGALGVDLGLMIPMGLLVSAFTAVGAYLVIKAIAHRIEVPMRPLAAETSRTAVLDDDQLPGLVASIVPILVPVVLISGQTVIETLARRGRPVGDLLQVVAILGNPNLAMLVAAAAGVAVLVRSQRPSRKELAVIIEQSLAGAGVIILITAGGGAFGAMLKEAQIGPAVQGLFEAHSGQAMHGKTILLAAFLISFVLKFAQGSSTVSMIATSAVIAPVLGPPSAMGFHPVYVAMAIGFGAQCGNWMNDSGFWVFAKMGGLTEVEALKTWTVTISSLAVIGFAFVLIFATALPLA